MLVYLCFAFCDVGGPSRETRELVEDGASVDDDATPERAGEDAVLVEPESTGEPQADEPVLEAPAEQLLSAAVVPEEAPTRRSTISPIPEQEGESHTSSASPELEEPAPLSASPELVPIPLEYVPLPSSVRSGTPSPEEAAPPVNAVPPESTPTAESAASSEEVAMVVRIKSASSTRSVSHKGHARHTCTHLLYPLLDTLWALGHRRVRRRPLPVTRGLFFSVTRIREECGPFRWPSSA